MALELKYRNENCPPPTHLKNIGSDRIKGNVLFNIFVPFLKHFQNCIVLVMEPARFKDSVTWKLAYVFAILDLKETLAKVLCFIPRSLNTLCRVNSSGPYSWYFYLAITEINLMNRYYMPWWNLALQWKGNMWFDDGIMCLQSRPHRIRLLWMDLSWKL